MCSYSRPMMANTYWTFIGWRDLLSCSLTFAHLFLWRLELFNWNWSWSKHITSGVLDIRPISTDLTIFPHQHFTNLNIHLHTIGVCLSEPESTPTKKNKFVNGTSNHSFLCLCLKKFMTSIIYELGNGWEKPCHRMRYAPQPRTSLEDIVIVNYRVPRNPNMNRHLSKIPWPNHHMHFSTAHERGRQRHS